MSWLCYRCQVIHDACATRDQEFNGRTIAAALGIAYAEVLSLAEWRRK